ncbi:CPBP family intramembrane glutamic endopeptidase [Gorillibacterium massiliense]|uniref:CPBP family intramembrane glutamic endopeptidase n=1 Tax=Gorillibacterium massiliense TaxID=1280390 RepID=UPI0004B74ACB|nr:CPBP family intramembrane glutamic endopeptidase [Gorillibacterium massiliense]
MEKKSAAKGHPILFSLMLGIVLTVLVSIASAAAEIQKLNDTETMLSQAVAFFIMALIITIYMKRKDATLGSFGFRRVELLKEKRVLYFIPLLIIALVQPIVGGINRDLALGDIVAILVFTMLVGYTEETVFRGIIRERLKEKSRLFYIVFSSVFFGILHMANAFGGHDVLEVLLQVANAFLLGIILALLIEMTNKIIPLMVFHFLFDAFANFTSASADNKQLLIISVLDILYLLYGAYLISVMLRKKQPVQVAA